MGRAEALRSLFRFRLVLFSMIILSVNIRGLKKKGMVGWLHSLCATHHPYILALQETMCEEIADRFVEFLWGSPNFRYIQKSANGRSGGGEGEFFLAVKGKIKGDSQDTIVVNVYEPHEDIKKRLFLESLENLMNYDNESWVLCGDFNEVRNIDERKNCEFNLRRANRFNNFIANSGLLEVPLIGKKFTRICDNGKKFSKLDRFLVSNSVINRWPELLVMVLDRKLSDHCPLLLRSKALDYGPKPVKIFDSWLNHPGAADIVSEAWNGQFNSRRPDIVFQLKLKNVKMALKNWSKLQFGELDSELESAKTEACNWEQIANDRDIDESERVKWLEARRRWLEKDRIKACMLKQKSRIKWATEGEENSKYFHSLIKRRNNKNSI
ncbi:uncharacterized protein [Rutidosis leptorrhynchoides]|uniref:uncharacterized protein n=1 Tax=Rutidosis leptorrhynchoides TaxID=125765 RepID=UPI003A9923B9